MLKGFTPPFTPDGRSSLAPAPPWHYAGWLFSIAYELDPAVANLFLPEGFGRATGCAAAHFCDWQATTDGSELLDPVYAQYREFFVLIEAERRGDPVNFCPFIYVDQDISMVRGWLQGLPKKLGSVWLTRSYPLNHPAAAPAQAGTRLGASLAVKDRRLAQAALTLTGGEGRRLGLLARPTYGLTGLPSLIGGPQAAQPRLVRMAADAKEFGPSFAADASLDFFDSPREELAALAPNRVVDASAGCFALTISRVADGEVP
ncbi:acetoacetate decarboxylase family protein [Azospirillum sp.]|uniref:acetoacetate decarboxylase family protein n=1 Tax=Azospirillum sp. TaxID=34012 RepID=UPI002D4EE08F|nr:acetoacetate decarboxylase family protein [Azospirillum sp.]HYD66936.1 acetoacetate decarboxylase family protein [Azospirillum sp.]